MPIAHLPPLSFTGDEIPLPGKQAQCLSRVTTPPCEKWYDRLAVPLNKALEQSDQPGIGDLQYLQEIIHRRITGS